ncbi:MAG TPA: haloacid dehalogenase-like hydrolase [Terriglobales bacterium]|jgi:phosphoserine phosphatase
MTEELMEKKTKAIHQNARSHDFIDSILELRPRLAVFDCDGTLWGGDAGERFFDWELKRKLVSVEVERRMRTRYAEYQAGRVSEDEMCGEMVTMHKGLKESDVLGLAREFFEQNFVQQIFPEMQELVRRLQLQSCDVWAVSSTNEWVIREAMQHFRIARERILAAAVEVNDDVISDRLIRVPSGPGKPKAILDVIGHAPDIAFGNSRWDVDMLALAKRAIAVNPNPDLEKLAQKKAWTIYWPAKN